MTLVLVKTTSSNCPKCKSENFSIINGAQVCMGCNTYFFKELCDIRKKGN